MDTYDKPNRHSSHMPQKEAFLSDCCMYLELVYITCSYKILITLTTLKFNIKWMGYEPRHVDATCKNEQDALFYSQFILIINLYMYIQKSTS
jgi:hypothetical protein